MPQFKTYEGEAAWFDANGDKLIELLAKHGRTVLPRNVERTQ